MPTILLVEDEIILDLSISLIMEDEGFCVRLAHDGNDGLEKVRSQIPDLVLTDYMMPRMDGLSMARTLRREGHAMPIILVTSVPAEAIAEEDRREVFDAYLGKPFNDRDLLRLVRRYLSGGGSGSGG